MLKKQLILLLFLMVVTPAFALPAKVKLNHTWMNDNYQSIELQLQGGEDFLAIPLINTLVEIWLKRDGAISGEVSPLIVVALVNNAEPTLILLSEHPESFEKWLNELEGMVFTDHVGTESGKLKKLKYNAVESMRGYSVSGRPELVVYAEQLILRLESISVRAVD